MYLKRKGNEVRPGNILVVGLTPCLQRTLIFQNFKVGEVNRTGEIYESASGKGTNVYNILQTLGHSPELITTYGGLNGQKFIALLEESSLANVQKVQVPFDTRICQTLINQSSGEVTELVEESKNISPEIINEIEVSLGKCFGPNCALILSGSPPPGAPEDIYSHWIHSCQKRGGYAFVDCQKQFLRKAIEAKAFLVKANKAEWEMTLGVELNSIQDYLSTLRNVLSKGVSIAIMTIGGDGMICCHEQEAWFVEHSTLDAVNPIGSGDATMAGLLSGVNKGMNIEEVLRLGAACGMANTQTKISGAIEKEVLDKCLANVSVRKID